MIELYHIAPLLSLIDAFRAATGVTDATISTRLFNDGKKVGQLRGAGSLTLNSASKAVEWLSANWPADTPWPDDVPRPGSSQLAVMPIDRESQTAPPSSLAGAAPSASTPPPDGTAAGADPAASAATLSQADEVAR